MTRLDPNRPKVPDVLPLVRDLYASPDGGAGCCLHIVLDDGNVEDSAVQYCFDNAEHERCRMVAGLLLRMSRTQRWKLYRHPEKSP